MKVWLDDKWDDPEVLTRRPPEGWIPVKTAQEAVDLIATGKVTEIGFDHDLGDERIFGSGYVVAKYIEEQAYFGRIPRIIWSVHSDNVRGRENIEAAMFNADKFWDRAENS